MNDNDNVTVNENESPVPEEIRNLADEAADAAGLPGTPAADPDALAAGPDPSGEAAEEGPRPIVTRPEVDTDPWYARIEAASLEELPQIEAEIRILPVDEDTLKPLQAAVLRRRWSLWEGELAALTADSDKLDCVGLLALAQQVRDSEYPEVLRERTLEALRKRFDEHEQEELGGLTAEMEALDISGLQEKIDQINAGPYTDQSKAPFLAKLNSRIDELHVQALSELCAGLEEADRETVAGLRSSVSQRDCAEVLKSEFFRRIEARQDELDVGDLETLTANLENRSPKELLALSEKLAGEGFNPKFINRFRLKTAVAREAAFCRQIDAELAGLDRMDRLAVTDEQASLSKRELPARVTLLAERELAERLYRVDLLGLLDSQASNFDTLNFEQLDEIRAAVARMDICERSKEDYLARLNQREAAAIMENTTTRVGLVEQVAAQFKVKRKDLILAADDEEYWSRLRKYWEGTGMEQPRDIPVFILDNASDLAFSGNRFWFRDGKKLDHRQIKDMERFDCMKHTFVVDIQVFQKDGTCTLTDSKLYKLGHEKLIGFLNECLRRWDEPNLEESYPMRIIHTPGFDRRTLEAPIPSRPLNADDAKELFVREYMARDKKSGTLCTNDEAWNAKQQKLAQGFELDAAPELVWFNTSGLLGSMKEGVAVGPRGLIIRAGKQPAQIIPASQIWKIEKTGNKKILLTTTGGLTQTVELPGDMAPMLLNYFRTLQLAEYFEAEEQAEA